MTNDIDRQSTKMFILDTFCQYVAFMENGISELYEAARRESSVTARTFCLNF